MKIIFKYYIILTSFFFLSSFKIDENDNYRLSPEVESNYNFHQKVLKNKKEIIVSANPYATQMAKKILDAGGNAADAAVTLQLVLGLVEPQSSGLGGGSFALFYDQSKKKITNYSGRETAPENVSQNLFLKNNGNPKKFFDAVVGGISVGVPGTLETLYQIHKDFGNLSWVELIDPVIKLAKNGFIPPKRFKEAIKKEKYLWNQNINIDYFNSIRENPEKRVSNYEYSRTLEKIAENYRDFYEGKIAKAIVKKVNNAKNNPGALSMSDMKNYKVQKKDALCIELKTNIFCGPNLPSSGGISIAQALLLYENYGFNHKESFNNLLNILEFVYVERSKYLADSDFQYVNQEELIDLKYLKKKFESFLKQNSKSSSISFKDLLSSTSHFSIVDKHGNVISMTSSIENTFGSRLYVEGFLLNNQLTDFSFLPVKDKKPVKNKVEGGKRPLSSMSPIIILDKNNEFLLSIGSPGGTAIISYVFKTIIDLVYKNVEPLNSIRKGNYLKKKNTIILETGFFDINQMKEKLLNDNERLIERRLTSGIAIIKKDGEYYEGAADIRRDGTVIGK